MGTRKGPKTKVASASSAIKRTTRSESKKKPIPMVRDRNTKSRHFAGSANVAGEARVKEELNVMLRAKGKTAKQTGQPLPVHSENVRRTRRDDEAEAQTQHSGTQEDDAIPVYARKKRSGHRKYEDWEDQIIIERRTAGEKFEDISKLLVSRPARNLCSRWHETLKHRIDDTVAHSLPKRKPNWTLEEEQLLVSLRESGKSWNEVAKHLPNRTAKRCVERWYKPFLAVERPPRKTVLEWQEWEERLLVSGYYAGLSWEEITKPITTRTIHATRSVWYHHFHSADQDKPWTSEELRTLTDLRAGGMDWDKISQEICGHSSNACRRQWYRETGGIQGVSHHKGKWSADEINTLIGLYNTIGARFQEISNHIPGRTAAACRTWLWRDGENFGVGEGSSEYWEQYFLDEPESGDGPKTGDVEANPIEATPKARAEKPFPSRIVTRNQQLNVDARKRKAIDIPMV